MSEHLRERLKRFKEQEEERLKEKVYKETLVSISVALNGAHLVPNVEGAVQSLKLPYTATLSELYDAAFLAFLSDVTIEFSEIRLLQCKDYNYSIVRSFSEKEMQLVIFHLKQ
ncbi:unnamed protein product [Gongylonema pulchrum]|uniref:Uncharacterized protein n=1 Tax=Gongylonema pulchrum TaxID=637853 RepID=A0A3P6RQL3_9BILA|nr:unnamed protein product [Gongylonema pulchrum]